MFRVDPISVACVVFNRMFVGFTVAIVLQPRCLRRCGFDQVFNFQENVKRPFVLYQRVRRVAFDHGCIVSGFVERWKRVLMSDCR
jgi:hypothetical protein